MEKHILTVDVEDNFTKEELMNVNDWGKYENQVVENTRIILSLLSEYDATATFFIVGLVAERHPEIVSQIQKDGHEIASHSYWHKPLTEMSFEEIEIDIKYSSQLLSGLSGKPVLGYRAMAYSVPEEEKKFYNLLKKYGFVYDSSRKIAHSNSDTTVQDIGIKQIYPSTLSFLGKRIVFSGGSYFRLLPRFFLARGFKKYNANNNPVMLYVHPWEFNKNQPKRNVSFKQRIIQSPLTFTTKTKLDFFLKQYQFVSIRDYLNKGHC